MPKQSSYFLQKLKRLAKKAFRDAYVRANVEHGLSHQIRLQRQTLGWSQAELAKRIGASGQSAIARLEDPSYGRYSLSTLLKLSAAFDVALLVKFVSYGKLLQETADLSPDALRAETFDTEYPKLLTLQAPRTQGLSVLYWMPKFSRELGRIEIGDVKFQGHDSTIKIDTAFGIEGVHAVMNFGKVGGPTMGEVACLQ